MMRFIFYSILLINVMSPFLHAADTGASQEDIWLLSDRIHQARCFGKIVPIDGQLAVKFMEAPQESSAFKLWNIWNRIIAEAQWTVQAEPRKPSGHVSPQEMLQLRRKLNKGQTDFDPALCKQLEKYPSDSPQGRLLERIQVAQLQKEDDEAPVNSLLQQLPPASKRPLFCCVGDYKRWESKQLQAIKHRQRNGSDRQPDSFPRRRVQVVVRPPAYIFEADDDQEDFSTPKQQHVTGEEGEIPQDSNGRKPKKSDDRDDEGVSLRAVLAKLAGFSGYSSD